ncbi:uncharacterized protein LOC135120863 [Zophobas morio]|uniref:uncharacterized protein LOC135120863 n=1 Tax=Zophobas morio TaxID=2755281 RepID=UPI00308336B8
MKKKKKSPVENIYEIRFYRSKPFFANETVSGQVVCLIQSKTDIKYMRCSVSCVLISKLSIYGGEDTIYRESKTLARNYVFDLGKHRFEFNFTLPEKLLPPSLFLSRKFFCHWMVTLKIYQGKPGTASNIPRIVAQRRFHKGILYYPNTSIVPKSIVLKKFSFFPFLRGDFYLQAKLERNVYYRGEGIPVFIEISNNTNRKIREILVQAIQKFKFTVEGSDLLGSNVVVDSVLIPSCKKFKKSSRSLSLLRRTREDDKASYSEKSVAIREHSNHSGRTQKKSVETADYKEDSVFVNNFYNFFKRCRLGLTNIRSYFAKKKKNTSRCNSYSSELSQAQQQSSLGPEQQRKFSFKNKKGIRQFFFKAVILPRVTESKGYFPVAVPSYITDLKQDNFSDMEESSSSKEAITSLNSSFYADRPPRRVTGRRSSALQEGQLPTNNPWRELLIILQSSGKCGSQLNNDPFQKKCDCLRPIYHPPSFEFYDDFGTLLALRYFITVSVKFFGGSLTVELPFNYSDVPEYGELEPERNYAEATSANTVVRSLVDRTHVSETPNELPPSFTNLKEKSLERVASIHAERSREGTASI